MSTKNETPVKATANTGSDTKTALASPEQPQSQTELPTKTVTTASNPGELSPEIIELLTELKDTVRGLNIRKLTVKTLRRSLSNVTDILADIDQLYAKE